jgi:hypothetical protein
LFPGSKITHNLVRALFPYNWSGLYFHPRRFRKHPPGLQNGSKNRHEILKLPNCKAVAVLDEGVASLLGGAVGEGKVFVFPDVADDASPDAGYGLLKEIRRRAGGRKIIASLGSQGGRKGLLTLLETARKSIGEDWFFLFAGKLARRDLSPDQVKTLHEAAETAENCFFHFETIPDEPQFNALVEASEVLFAAYLDFPHSSNLLTKAAIFEKPAIVSDGYCMAERVRQYRLGRVIFPGNSQDCAEAIRQLLNSTPSSTGELSPDYEGYRLVHSTAQLKLAFKDLIEQASIA